MDTFLPYSRPIDRFVYQYPLSSFLCKGINMLMGWQGHGMKEFTGYYKHAKTYTIQETMDPKIFNNYYKFIFVRNPLDFIVSHYFYILQSKHHPNHKAVSPMSFSQFVQWYLNLKPALQIDFLLDRDRKNQLVDFIGKFENLEKDIQKICKTLNIKPKTLTHKNPSRNRKKKAYSEYYTKKDLKAVTDYFRLDFEILEYSQN